jgi:hypothetical protein
MHAGHLVSNPASTLAWCFGVCMNLESESGSEEMHALITLVVVRDRE